MARALELAARGRCTTHPNPRVGCVIVQGNEIVGEGFHQRAGEPHAEVHALRQAGERARGAEVYVSLEPCCHHGRTGPCTEALIAAGVRKVWAALRDPNPVVAGQGAERLRAAGIEVEFGLAQDKAAQLNRGFVSRMQRGRPFVVLKLAASLDGRTAMASGESKWITGEAARADVHRLRAEAGAVLTTAETVLADDPQLTAREVDGLTFRPDRIVLDTRGRVPESARVWNEDGARRFRLRGIPPSPLPRPGSGHAFAKGGVAEVVPSLRTETNPPLKKGGRGDLLVPGADGGLDLNAAVELLGQQEINEVLVECGPRLAGALLQQRLVDELVLYLAPALLGHEARPLALLPGLGALDQRLRLRYLDVRQLGEDLRLTAVPE
ncbi:MAG TPA: bifunctional diaminohydroxyphosphoribosylaminopyrimidine deaminase/5-amino-6-(5-phosphoribosylamino)uracil reductase RibD [Solimonas sp.]|nr:bifunctional diaminohydroxyphosphoribosylaminopyrimidine deaminase/5-amino-6-(5-phosphoribosylamino)uracil reductase RibD [Solimonas sp.]